MEEILRAHRDEALKLLKENRAQSAEGIEILVRQRMPKITAALQSGGAPLSAPQSEALYQEMLDLSFVMFALGYTLAHTLEEKPRSRK
ncbi:MAG: hypothetical protein ACOY94_18475 [Bacillota bacterium]